MVRTISINEEIKIGEWEIDMKTVERRERIVVLVGERGFVSVSELSRKLQVSEVTIRSDLTFLDSEGLLKRALGGAVPFRSCSAASARFPGDPDPVQEAKSVARPPLGFDDPMAKEKLVIAELAADRIVANETVFLDGSNTSLYLARELARRTCRIIVATNSIELAEELGAAPQIQVILLGGEFHSRFHATFGSLTEAAVSGIRASKAFVSPMALELDRGIMIGSSMTGSIRRLMLQNATQRVLLADHSKFSTTGILPLVDWEGFDCVITDRRPPEAFLARMTAHGISCIVPESGGTPCI